MIPTFRPPSTTPLPPHLKPVPKVVARLEKWYAKRSFAHFPYTHEINLNKIEITDGEYYARFSVGGIFMGATYMRIALVSSTQ